MSEHNFCPRAVSDFLTAKYVFEIPSFQRGYRWTSKQVKDLLNDIYRFANDKSADKTIYYLQPLVVRGADHVWQVLDGQQRLTTLKLILDAHKGFLSDEIRKSINDYEIKYLSRPNLDFANASPTDNMDSYYVAKARRAIDEWKSEHRSDFKGMTKFANVLFGIDDVKEIKFIWYEVEGEDSSDAGAIAIFNRLNRGKLKLTPSELIKALLIISADEAGVNSDFQTVLSMEWNEIERQFMRDDFFSFINAGNQEYDTRTDLLFNHVTISNGAQEKDADFAYRWFQDKYDNNESVLDIWENDVKAAYDMIMQWYSDPEMYNCIGFLSQYGVKISTIRDRLAQAKKDRKEQKGSWSKTDNIRLLRTMIRELFNPLYINNKSIDFPDAADSLDYNSDNEKNIRKVLLLFNITAYSGQRLRFPFNLYVKEKWDIEHVDSQTENPLTKKEDQRQWLTYAGEIIADIAPVSAKAKQLNEDIVELLSLGIDNDKWHEGYKDMYQRIAELEELKSTDPVADKDSLGNLTLLDSATNRGYGNALFPYKRKCIVDREQKGGFVPICTRNLFLKYYSGNCDAAGIDRMKWCEHDAQAHLAAIHKAIDPFFSEPMQ